MNKRRLGDICKVVSGSTPKSGVAEYWDGTINWITPAELSDDSDVIYESQRKITERAVEDTSLKSFPKGTVILSSRAPIGKVAIAGSEMYCNQGFKNLICSDAVYNRYLYYFMKYSKNYLNSLGRGATFKEISKKIVENIEIPLPMMTEQKAIVERLDSITHLIQLRQQQLEKLDVLVKSQFIEMFGDVISNDKLWPHCNLGDQADIGSSKRIFAREYVKSGVPFYRSKEIIELGNHQRPSVELFISQERYQEIKDKYGAPKKGDILMTAVGTIGKFWTVDTESPFYYKDGNLLYIRTNKFNPIFFRKLLEALIDDYKHEFANGSAYAALPIEKLKNMGIVIPPMELQNCYGDIVEQADKSKFEIKQDIVLLISCLIS